MCLIINIETIKHSQHRYPTVGDWNYTATGDWRIRVSEMANWRFEFLVAFHEMIEMALCRDKGITEQEVTKFDKAYEANRPHEDDDSEPGDDPGGRCGSRVIPKSEFPE